MAVIPIRVVPDPILRKKTKQIKNIDGSLQKLINDMFETMHAAPGVGLAAPQVGSPLRIAVISIPEGDDFILINPEIVRKSGEIVVSEGCLSIPGYVGEIKRAETVTVKALDRNGKAIRIKGADLLGQALQHEIDHLDGVLYVDHLEDQDDLRKISPGEQEL